MMQTVSVGPDGPVDAGRALLDPVLYTRKAARNTPGHLSRVNVGVELLRLSEVEEDVRAVVPPFAYVKTYVVRD